MFAPLSAKLKQKMQLDTAKVKADEQRKQMLHDVKMQEAIAKGQQALQFKTRDQMIKETQKAADTGIKSPVPPLGLAIQSTSINQPVNPESGPNDKIPALLAEGEAVIPASAAQDPENKPLIADMIDQGRQGYQQGTTKVGTTTSEPNYLEQLYDRLRGATPTKKGEVPRLDGMVGQAQEAITSRKQKLQEAEDKAVNGYQRGTTAVSKWGKNSMSGPRTGILQGNNLLPLIPIMKPRRRVKGYEDGTGYAGGDTVESLSKQHPEDIFGSYYDNLLKTEGGYSNNPADRGGETNYGISSKHNPGVDVNSITPDDARAIYKKNYWDAIKADDLPEGLRGTAFDAAVNQGPTWTRGALSQANGDPSVFNQLRRDRYASIIESNPEQAQFKNGWEKRVAQFDVPKQPNEVPSVQPEGSWEEVPQVNPLANTTGRASVMRSLAPVPEMADTTGRASVMDVLSRTQEPQIDRIRRENMGKPLSELQRVDVNEGRPPVASLDDVPPLDQEAAGNGLTIPVKPEEVNSWFSKKSFDNVDILTKEQRVAMDMEAKGEDGKGYLQQVLSNIYGGPDAIINPKTTARFILGAVGGLITGGSVGGSLKWAGLDTLKNYDKNDERKYQREYQQKVAQDKALNDLSKAAITRAGANHDKSVSGLLSLARERGRNGSISQAAVLLAHQFAAEGKYTNLNNLLSNPQLTATDIGAAGGVGDPVYIMKNGFSEPIKAYHDKNNNGYVYQDGGTIRRTSEDENHTYSDYKGRSPVDMANDAVKMLSSNYTKEGKDGKPAITDKGTVAAELVGWINRNKRLGLPHDPGYFMDVVNMAISDAANTGETNPSISKLLDIATINTASLSDRDKLLNREGNRVVPTSYIGKAYSDITTPFKDKKGIGGFENPKKFMDYTTQKYVDFKKSGLNPLEGVPNKVIKGVNFHNKIKEAPNDWYAFVYRQLYELSKK